MAYKLYISIYEGDWFNEEVIGHYLSFDEAKDKFYKVIPNLDKELLSISFDGSMYYDLSPTETLCLECIYFDDAYKEEF